MSFLHVVILSIVIIPCFCGNCSDDCTYCKEIFTIPADDAASLIFPVFSSDSTFEDFDLAVSKALDLCRFAVEQYGSKCYVYVYQQLGSVVYNISDPKWDDPNFWLNTYENSKCNNLTRCLDLIEEVQQKIIPDVEICMTHYCTMAVRSNLVLVTDLYSFPELPDLGDDEMKQFFWFAIVNSTEKCKTLGTRQYMCYNPDEIDINKEFVFELLGEVLYYPLDVTRNYFNTFLTVNATNETQLYTAVRFVIDGFIELDSEYFVSINAANFVAVSVEYNGTFYETVIVIPHFYNGETIPNLKNHYYFMWDERNNHYVSGDSFSIKQTSDYFKKIFTSLSMEYCSGYCIQHREQTNVIVTTEFPFWILNQGFDFTSMKRHLDVYLYNGDLSTDYDNIYKQVHENFQKILIKDKNSSTRLNHVDVMGNLVDQHFDLVFVSNRDTVLPTSFDIIEKKNNLTLIWIMMAVISLLFLIAVVIAFILYRKRKSEITQVKIAAENSKISESEVVGFNEVRKDLFVDPKRLEINFEAVIGKGSTATVYYGRLEGPAPVRIQIPSFETREFTDCKVAVKIGNDFTQNSMEKFLLEVDAARKIGFDKNICCLLGWTFFRGMPSLIFEPVDWNLLDWSRGYRDKESNFSIKSALKILWQITSAMEKVTSVNLVHRDLAARNVLLTPRLQVKIGDFGLCCACDETFTYTASLQNKLPIRWLSLEALMDRLFSEYSDVWSFGILAYEVFSFGQVPYSNLEVGDLVEFLKSGQRLGKLKNIPEDLWGLFEACWIEDRFRRPKFSELKEKIRIFLENETTDYGYLFYFDE